MENLSPFELQLVMQLDLEENLLTLKSPNDAKILLINYLDQISSSPNKIDDIFKGLFTNCIKQFY